jgi:predicted protein tyrosine phosphatase
MPRSQSMGDFMLNRVLFVSQRQAVAMRPPAATALISITDVNQPPAVFLCGWSQIFRTSFDDVDPLTFPGMDDHLHEITASQVAGLCVFAAENFRQCRRIIVHCRHGISRSAAVAKAIAEAAGVGFPSDYDEYNHFVYETLRRPMIFAFEHQPRLD